MAANEPFENDGGRLGGEVLLLAPRLATPVVRSVLPVDG